MSLPLSWQPRVHLSEAANVLLRGEGHPDLAFAEDVRAALEDVLGRPTLVGTPEDFAEQAASMGVLVHGEDWQSYALGLLFERHPSAVALPRSALDPLAWADEELLRTGVFVEVKVRGEDWYAEVGP